jgi:hypothetical protein
MSPVDAEPDRLRAGDAPAASRAARLAGWLLEHGPPGTERALGLLQRHLAPLLRLRVPLLRLHGADRHGSVSVVVADPRPSVAYLVERYADATLRAEPLGATPLLALPRALARLGADADLVIARVERPAARWLFGATHLRVPEAVGAELSASPDPETLRRVRSSQGNNIRRVRRAGLIWSVSRRPEDFERFHADMYVPFTRRRFGEQAYLRNPHRLRRAFRSGFLLFVEQGGERIAGALFVRRGRSLVWTATGIAGGDPALAERGALSALYLFALEVAQRGGVSQLDLGASRPSLRDGVLVHKKRWGARLVGRDDVHCDLCLTWRAADERILRFLARAPLVFRDGGDLSALTALPRESADAPGAREVWHELRMRGLRRLVALVLPGVATGGPAPEAGPDEPTLWLAPPAAPRAALAAAQPASPRISSGAGGRSA